MQEKNRTISKSEDSKETVNYSFDYDVCKSKDTSGCQMQSKRLHKAENDSELFTPPNKRIKIGQSCSLAETEILKQPNDNGRYDSQDNVGTNDSQDDVSADDSQDDVGTYDSQDDNGADGSQDDVGADDSQDDVGTEDSQDDVGTDDSQEGDCSDSCNKKDKEDLFHGTHEIQVSEGGEADLHKHYNNCKKNPGHTKFVPVNDFNINNLPEGYHEKDLVEFIKATADLTVRVAVKMTSTKRPEFWPNTTDQYHCYNMRGSNAMRVGTGMVLGVCKFTEEDIKKHNMGTCPCHKCQHSDTPSKVWGIVIMHTARHVVFDDLEARHTTCRLFFDRQDSPLVPLDGWTVLEANIEEDWCELEYVTCDVDLLDKLENMRRYRCYIFEKVINQYARSIDEVKLTFIVSHPHGCPKQISVGQWIDRHVVARKDDYHCYTKYTYTTCTCPGSSGAYVYPLGSGGWFYDSHLHTGVNFKGNNSSGVGRELSYNCAIKTNYYKFFE